MKRVNRINNLVTNLLLHIEINTLNLPYWKLPRPYRANPLSKFFRRIFEKDNLRKVLGLNLATAMVLIPLGNQVIQAATPEKQLNVVIADIDESEASAQIVTKAREFINPVVKHNQVSQGYRPGHLAYDITGPLGSDVIAFTSGRVHQIESGTFGLGKYIVLDHGHGLVSVYAHLRSFNVKIGDHVKTGDKIGEIGMTGYTTGPHVHFEVHDNGVPVNPKIYLEF